MLWLKNKICCKMIDEEKSESKIIYFEKHPSFQKLF